MNLLAFLVTIWEPLDGNQICCGHVMAIYFGRGFFKVYEFKNATHDSFLNTSIFIWVLCLWLPPYNHCVEPWLS
jgi:hypothetical protein